jgi:DegV family protein with EDD domain
MNFVLSTDSGAEMLFDQALADNIVIVPFRYAVGGTEHIDVFNRNEEYQTFYRALAEHRTMLTICPSVGQCEEAFDEIFETGKRALIHIASASALSDAYKNAVKAAKNTLIKYPGRELYILDSRTVSAGQRLLLHMALQLREKGGMPTAEAFISLQNTAALIRTFLLPDPVYLKNSTDLSESVGFGGLLNLYALFCADGAGRFVKYGTYKGLKSALKHLTADYVNLDPALRRTAFTSCGHDFSFIQALAALLKETGAADTIDHDWMGPVLCRYAGPAALCFSFLSDKPADKPAKIIPKNH